MDLLGHHLCGHFEMYKEVFAVLLGHGRGKEWRSQQTNRQCEKRPISEHMCSQRVHCKEHGSSGPFEYMFWTIKGEECYHAPKGFRFLPNSGSMSLSWETITGLRQSCSAVLLPTG